MPRVLVLNNYPLESVWQEVKAGDKPDHHLYGINHLQRGGYDVKIIPFRHSAWLQSASRLLGRLPIPLGDLDQQFSTLRELNQADLIYAPCQTQAYALSYLRAIGLLHVPLVCLAHHPLNSGRLARWREPIFKWMLSGVDAFPSLSQEVACSINGLGGKPGQSVSLPWGPDANYYPATAEPGYGAIAAGRTGRDFLTFGQAATRVQAHAKILCLEDSVVSGFEQFGSTVEVIAQSRNRYMSYPELLELYARSRVLAIPLTADRNLAGLTSLMDALGMGKPVIMTRHPLIDLDIEAEGIGRWVAPGDIEGWGAALRFFEEHEEVALQMGKRARALVDGGFNSLTFAKRIMDIFAKLLEHGRA